MIKRGIDISTYQGDIDLKTLRNRNQLDFVIIKVGYEVEKALDDTFKRNVELCKELNIPYGFYWCSCAVTVEDAEAEANAFIDAIKSYTPIYGCWFDAENTNDITSDDVLIDVCHKFCETVSDAGYYMGVYATENWFKQPLVEERLNKFDKWIAQWPTTAGRQKALKVNPNSRTNFSLWQFTSEGKLSGYKGNLNMNYAYKEFIKTDNQPTTTINENESDIKVAVEAEPSDDNDKTIIKGSKIRFMGTKSYSGIRLPEGTYQEIFNVIEISGDRVVIGKGTAVTAAVNIKDCQKV